MSSIPVVGGARDGDRVESDAPIIFMLDTRELNRRPYGGYPSPTDHVQFETLQYVRTTLSGDQVRFSVYIPADWTGDQLIAHLLEKACPT